MERNHSDEEQIQPCKDLEESNLHSQELFVTYYSGRDWNFYRPILAEVIIYVPPGRILDIGCGLGLFMECAKNFGIAAEGIEGSRHAVECCMQKGLLVTQQLLSKGLPYADNAFSAIILNQVLEHLPAEVGHRVLRESHRVLCGGGIAIIKSPNKFEPSQKSEPTHINLFTPLSLCSSLERAGFEIVDRRNSFRDFGLGKIGKVWARLFYKLFHEELVFSSANCVARKP